MTPTRARLTGAVLVVAAFALAGLLLSRRHATSPPAAVASGGEPRVAVAPADPPPAPPAARAPAAPAPLPLVHRRARAMPRFMVPRSKYADLPVASINLAPPPIAMGLSAVSRQQPREEMRAGLRCLRDYGKRHPSQLDDEGWWNGALALTLDVHDGKARVVDVAGMKGEDDETVACTTAKIPWLAGTEFPVAGAPDGILRVEWTYMVGTRGGP